MRAIALFLSLAGLASALTLEEVVQLSESGVADDIILDQMKADESVFEISAAEIVYLQKKKVSPLVLRYMISARGRQAPAIEKGKVAPIPIGEPVKPLEEGKDARLTVRNVAKGNLSVIVYSREREIVLVQGEIQSATVLLNGARAELSLPSGLYRIRWANEESFRELSVSKSVETKFEFRDDDRFARGVRAVAIVDGKEEADVLADKPEPLPTTEELIANPPARVYKSPTNSSVTVIRDIQQVPTRLVIVRGNYHSSSRYYGSSCAPTYSNHSVHGCRSYGIGYSSRDRSSFGSSHLPDSSNSSWHGYGDSHYGGHRLPHGR